MQQRNIYCIVGRSGSGKTSVCYELWQEEYNVIQSYTTRPPRRVKEWGHTFINFISATDERKYFNSANVIAYAELYGYKYWAEKHQYYSYPNSLYVIDPATAHSLQKKEEELEAKVYIILLAMSPEKAKGFMLKQRKKEDVEQRMKQDNALFRTVKCDYAIDTNELSVLEAAQEIKVIIERERRE